MSTPSINKDSNKPIYQARLTPTLSSEAMSPEELLKALQNGSVSNDELVENLIALVKALQSLCVSLQESTSKKALNDGNIQTKLADMNIQISEETEAQLADYLRKLEASKSSSLMDDIFGTILPFLAVVFPPLLAVYPMGPMSLFLNPDAPFGLGEIGKQLDSALGDGASKWFALALEIIATIAISVVTCGAGGVLLQGSKMITKEVVKAVAKEVIKNLAILGASKAISEGGLDYITDVVITAIEKVSGEELSEEAKAIIKGVVRMIAQVILVLVAIKCSSSKDGSMLGNLTKMFSTTDKLQKAMVGITFVLQAGQAGMEIWGGVNTLEVAKVQKRMDKLKAIITEITGIDVNERSKHTQPLVKELKRALEAHEIDLSGFFDHRSKAANIVSNA